MKIALTVSCLFFTLIVSGQNQKDSTNNVSDTAWQKILAKRDQRFVGKSFDTFSFFTKDSVVFSNANLKGKVTFINFWFEACPPCVAEFDALNALYLKYKNNPGFIFVSFTSDSEETVAQVREKYHITFPVVTIKKEDCYRLNQQNGFPTSIILSSKGVIKFMHSGGSLEKNKINVYFTNTLYPVINKEIATQN